MAASERIELEGIAEWAKVFEENRDMAEWHKDSNGAYSITLLLDEENAEKVRKSGTQKKMVQDPEGRGTVFTPVRKHSTQFDWQGGPPAVATKAGVRWDTERDGYIGNGSRVRVLLSVYETKTGRKGTRLDAIQVLDLVPYEGAGGGASMGGFFKDYTNELVQPKKEQAPKPAPKAPEVQLEDDIPF